MKLVSWERFQEINHLKQEINRLFDRISSSAEPRATEYNVGIPSIEIQENNDTIWLKLEIPGVSAEQLDIQVSQQHVSVRGQRPFPENLGSQTQIRSEFYYGKIERNIALPALIQPERTIADCKHGIVHLKLIKQQKNHRKESGESKNVLSVFKGNCSDRRRP
ncbi:MAG: Hsp20/alpha crystallin family protein [Cyanobacteriota bacterium]|nr:Hsp20/alpha crystallin family protein [Cyanobacteriota bacterium]